MYKLAIVRNNYLEGIIKENRLFQDLPHFDSIFVGFLGESPKNKSVNSINVGVKTLIPDLLANLITRKPYSTTSFVKLCDIEGRLENFDVINCFEVFSFVSRQCARVAKRMNIPLSVSVFETFPTFPLHYFPPYSWNVVDVLKQADRFIAFTNKAAHYLMNLGVLREKIKVIYPGVDLEKFHLARSRTDREKIRILFVGGYNREKGLSVLLQAFSMLCRDRSDVELWICASRAMRDVEKLAYAYARRFPIRIFGHIDHDRMPEIYRECDIFCHPSFDRKKLGMKVWEEEFGFTLVEAMASGLPIVATDCGAMPEVVGSENLILPQKSPDTLYRALGRIVNDEGCRRYLERANRRRAEKLFDIKGQRAKLDKVLYDLVTSW